MQAKTLGKKIENSGYKQKSEIQAAMGGEPDVLHGLILKF